MGLWNPTLRKVREEWGSPVRGGFGLQQVPFGFAQGRLSPGFQPDSE